MDSRNVEKEVLVDSGDTIVYSECERFGIRAVIDEGGNVVSYLVMKDNAVVLDLDEDEYNKFSQNVGAIAKEKFLIWREFVRREMGETK